MIQRRIVPQHSEEVDDHEAEAGKGDLVLSCLEELLQGKVGQGLAPTALGLYMVSSTFKWAREGGVSRHRHGKAIDSHMGVERFQDVL